MKISQNFALFTGIALLFLSSAACATEGIFATPEQIINLKNDLRDGRIAIGKTRLKEIQREYGEAPTIQDTERKIVYDYGDLKIEIVKDQFFRRWETDSSRKAAYSKDINDLRRDLQGENILGDMVSSSKIISDYDDPTESYVSNKDGAWSIYYYGDLKLIFENVFTVKSWKGSNLDLSAAGTDSAKKKPEAKK